MGDGGSLPEGGAIRDAVGLAPPSGDKPSPATQHQGEAMNLRKTGVPAVLVMTVLTLAACSSSTASPPSTTSTATSGAQSTAGNTASAPGVTPTSVSVGQVDTLSGPVPGLFQGAEEGTEAYIDYVNANGGVYGRKIHLDVDDDGFSADNYSADTQQLVAKDFALVGGFSLFDASGVPAIDSAKIPDITVSLSQSRNLDAYNYSPDPLIPGSTRLGPLVYYKQHDPEAIKHVGTIYSDVSTAEAQTQAVLAAMQSLGYDITYQRVVNPLESDFTSDVLRMKQSGVQMVYIVGLAVTQVADLAQNMQQENYTPKIFSTNGVAYDSSYVTDASTAANDTYTDQQSALFGGQDASSVPAVSQFDTWVRKVNASAHLDTYGVYGWASAQLFVQALRAAGRNPTRASLITALNSITSFDASGLLAPANPAQKRPETCWILIKVANGKWERTGPTPKSGFICSPGGYYYAPGYKPFVRPGT